MPPQIPQEILDFQKATDELVRWWSSSGTTRTGTPEAIADYDEMQQAVSEAATSRDAILAVSARR